MKHRKPQHIMKDEAFSLVTRLIDNPLGFIIVAFLIIGTPIKYPVILPYIIVLFCVILYALVTNILFSELGSVNFYSRARQHVVIILNILFFAILCSLVPSMIILVIMEFISKEFADKYFYHVFFVCVLGTAFAWIISLSEEKDMLRDRIAYLEAKHPELEDHDEK